VNEELVQEYEIDRALENDLALFEDYGTESGIPEHQLGQDLTTLALASSNAKTDLSPYFKAHREYFVRVITTIKRGGSGLLLSDLAGNMTQALEEFPPSLFEQLDADWQNSLP
jgi:hypothetical protein